MTRAALLAAVVVFGVADAQQPQFRASTSLVRLDVSVTDGRGAIRKLGPEDFIVTDRGARQDIDVAESFDAALDLVLIAPPLSAVAYITADQTARVEAGLRASLELVEDRDRLAVLRAGTPPTRLRAMAFGRPTFGVEAFTGGDYAAMFDTIAVGLGEFVPSDRRRAVLAFTNGSDFRSTIGFDSLVEIAGRPGPAFVLMGTLIKVEEEVRSRGLVKDPYGGEHQIGDTVTGQVNGFVFPAKLNELARKTGGIAVNLSTGDPAQIMADTFMWLRHQYVISYRPPVGAGWHPVTVKVNRRGAIVTAREGYFVD